MGQFRLSLPSDDGVSSRAGKILAWNADGTEIIYVDASTSTTFTQGLATLTITAQITPGTVLDVTSSGTGYTVAGDVVSLGASSSEFTNDVDLEVNLNGIEVCRGVDVLWNSASTLNFPNKTLYVGEVITIQQRTG